MRSSPCVRYPGIQVPHHGFHGIHGIHESIWPNRLVHLDYSISVFRLIDDLITLILVPLQRSLNSRIHNRLFTLSCSQVCKLATSISPAKASLVAEELPTSSSLCSFFSHTSAFAVIFAFCSVSRATFFLGRRSSMHSFSEVFAELLELMLWFVITCFTVPGRNHKV